MHINDKTHSVAQLETKLNTTKSLMLIMHTWESPEKQHSHVIYFPIPRSVQGAVHFQTVLTLPFISAIAACSLRNTFLPSSSSSEVIDLDRKVSAVVGARFGGGGALH